MNNKEKIEAINKWQKCKFVHQLTCGKEKCNGVLEGKVYGDEKDDGNILDIQKEFDLMGHGAFVYLECPNCDYTQEFIPGIVYNLNYEPFERLEEIISEKKKNE